VARVEQHPLRAAPHPKGRVLAFLPTKGSSGATFLSCTLGYALSTHLDKKLLLIDLNLQVGDAAFFLSDKNPPFTLADVCQEVHRLDASMLAASAVQVLPNFSILASPGGAEKAMQVKPEHVARVIKAAVMHYDFVLLDLDRALDAVTLVALDNADLIMPVMQQSLPYLRDEVRLVKAFTGLGYGLDRIRPIVNRYDRKDEITLEQMSTALGIPVYHTVPYSYFNVTSAINQGKALASLDDRNEVVRAIDDIAQDLTGIKVSKEGWLRRMLGH
jgi:pilus assembly protein CpaE